MHNIATDIFNSPEVSASVWIVSRYRDHIFNIEAKKPKLCEAWRKRTEEQDSTGFTEVQHSAYSPFITLFLHAFWISPLSQQLF